MEFCRIAHPDVDQVLDVPLSLAGVAAARAVGVIFRRSVCAQLFEDVGIAGVAVGVEGALQTLLPVRHGEFQRPGPVLGRTCPILNAVSRALVAPPVSDGNSAGAAVQHARPSGLRSGPGLRDDRESDTARPHET